VYILWIGWNNERLAISDMLTNC